MSEAYPRVLSIATVVGAGLTAGVYFAFSTFVMTAVGRLPDAEAIAAMNAINKAAPTPWFMLALFGTGAACIPLSVTAFRRLDEPWAIYLLIGSALYLISVVLTVVYHVPRNDALARVDPTGPGAAHAWSQYSTQWTTWNHVRTLSSLGGAITLTLALPAM